MLGNYVYVDGGMLSQIDDPDNVYGPVRGLLTHPTMIIHLTNSPTNAQIVNSTLSIPLSRSWDTLNVSIRAIPKFGPIKDNVHLWTDHESDIFYSYGGKFLNGVGVEKNELWQFNADGIGGGTWGPVRPANELLFKTLKPVEKGAYFSTTDTGYIIGGDATGQTGPDQKEGQPIPGMLTFNMKTKFWQNGTTDFSPVSTLIGGSAHWIPNFGPNGLGILFGGHAPRVDSKDSTTAEFRKMDVLTLFDPVTKKVYNQATTGDIPVTPRIEFCVVGFEHTGPKGYDIFLYGGANRRDRFAYEDAYILSLPGFVWTKVVNPPTGRRSLHTCVAVGKRQVLSIGGINSEREEEYREKDPAFQGLKLFDMSKLEWTDVYDADAAPYERAEVVRQWYANG